MQAHGPVGGHNPAAVNSLIRAEAWVPKTGLVEPGTRSSTVH